MTDRQAVFQAVEDCCKPLIDRYGLRVIARTDTTLTQQVWLRRATVGLRVLLDWKEWNPMIYVYRLDPSVGDQIEEGVPEWSRSENYEISAFMWLDEPGSVPQIRPPLEARTATAVKSELTKYVKILDHVAGPALRGDFTQFPALKTIIEENARAIREKQGG